MPETSHAAQMTRAHLEVSRATRPARDADPRSERRVGSAFSQTLRSTEPAPAGKAHSGGEVAEVLREVGGSIARGQHALDRAIRASRNGRVLSHQELLGLQAGVYRYTQELELAAKMVDKASNVVKQTLRSQR